MAITKRTVEKQEENQPVNKLGITVGQTMYYAQIMPSLGIYEVLEGKVRTVDEDWFCILEKRTDGYARLFENSHFGKTVFNNRGLALEKVLEAQMVNDK